MTHLTDRQLAITLAALRYIQGHLYESPMFAAERLFEKDPIVKPEEIDEICDLINDPDFHEEEPLMAVLTTLDGVEHKVRYDNLGEFIAENRGNLRTHKLEMRRPPTTLPDLETKWLSPDSVEMLTVDNIDDLPNRTQGIVSRAQRFSIVIEEDTSEEHF